VSAGKSEINAEIHGSTGQADLPGVHWNIIKYNQILAIKPWAIKALDQRPPG